MSIINKVHKNALKKQKCKKLLKTKIKKNKPKISKDQMMNKTEEMSIKKLNIPINMPKISKEQLMTKIQEVAGESKAKSGKKVNNARVKKVSCRACEPCLRPDCSQCTFCLDKPKFGGPGKKKQKCIEKICQNMSLYN